MAGRKTGGETAQTGEQANARQPKGRVVKEERPETGLKSGANKTRTAKAAPVEVTFSVTVPETTARMKKNVYLAGNFSQFNNKMGDWDAGGQKMKKVDATHYTLTVKIPQNTTVEYKYTLGGWEQVERDASCADTMNRHMTTGSSETQTVNDVVQNWAGDCGS